mmetsp:Transcript_47461/g.78666  ORF Transcript_47461/g.78666 Transcript_47461/m.78666 type:complete len:426 (+) Transcript_47461:483-1760(+)
MLTLQKVMVDVQESHECRSNLKFWKEPDKLRLALKEQIKASAEIDKAKIQTREKELAQRKDLENQMTRQITSDEGPQQSRTSLTDVLTNQHERDNSSLNLQSSTCGGSISKGKTFGPDKTVSMPVIDSSPKVELKYEDSKGHNEKGMIKPKNDGKTSAAAAGAAKLPIPKLSSSSSIPQSDIRPSVSKSLSGDVPRERILSRSVSTKSGCKASITPSNRPAADKRLSQKNTFEEMFSFSHNGSQKDRLSFILEGRGKATPNNNLDFSGKLNLGIVGSTPESRLRLSSCGIEHNLSNARHAENSVGEESFVDPQSSFHLSAVQRPTPKLSELTSNSTLATEITIIEEVSQESRQTSIEPNEPNNSKMDNTEQDKCQKAEDEKAASPSDKDINLNFGMDTTQKVTTKKTSTKRIHIRNKQQLTYSAN